MTELIVSRGDTFPRAFLDVYRSSKTSEQLYNDLKSSKSDELVLQNSADIPVPSEMHHGHSEGLLDCAATTTTSSKPAAEDKHNDTAEDLTPKNYRRRIQVYDKVDPEDSIRDIVSENDFYRFVLFKKHYDKYLHLSQKYEEARNIAYYLEEKYHEVKTERDDLIQQRNELTKRLESNESLLREKEDEVFLQFERVVYLEEQCDKLKVEKEKCIQQKELLEKERDKALKLLQEQARESEHNRRKLERARQEVVHHMTRIKNEKDTLERENGKLKEELEAERKGIGRYLSQIHRSKRSAATTSSSSNTSDLCEKQGDMKVMEQNATLTSQFQKAVQHLATCKKKKCSVCTYTKETYGKLSPSHRKYEKLFGCLQTPFLEVRNMMRPPPSPMSSAGEGGSLSEWFCPLTGVPGSECSSFSIPINELGMSYMDDASDTSSTSACIPDHESDQDRLSNAANSVLGFGSDSGFSSDICGDYKSNSATPKEKLSAHGAATLDEDDCAKLTRTKWTASFRKLINRIRK